MLYWKRVVSFAKLIFKLSMTQKYSIELIEEHDAVNFTAFILARKNSLNLKGSLKSFLKAAIMMKTLTP